MVTATPVLSQTPKERGEALKKNDDAPRQKYTRLFYTDATGKITAFTITLFERTATGSNGKQLAYTREQWKEIVEEKTKQMKQANMQAAGSNTAAPDLFTGIAGFESSADETTGVKFSIPSTTPPTAGNPPPAPREIIIPSSTDRARDFNTLAHAMDPRDASLLSDSPRVSTSQSQRASLPDWWDTTMADDLTKEQIDAVLAAPSIGIRNDGSGNTCFFNTMFNAYILHDRELIDALLKHRHDEPTKRIANYLYNYINYRSKHPDSSLSFINTEQFRKDLHQIAPARGYLSGQHDAGQAYLTLRGALGPKPKGMVESTGWLKDEECTVTQRTYYRAPKATDRFYTTQTTLDRPKAQTKMEKFLRKSQEYERAAPYHLKSPSDPNASFSVGEAFSEGKPDLQNPTIHISLSQKSKSPLKLDELVRYQYFDTPATTDSETVLQPIIITQDLATGSTTMGLQPCKQLRQTRILAGEPPKILIFEFDGSGEVTILPTYTLASAYRQKVADGSDAPAVQYALKSATVRPGDSPISGGHYYSYDQRGTKWYRTNDTEATEITENVMLTELSKTRRSLVYERIDAAPAVVPVVL